MGTRKQTSDTLVTHSFSELKNILKRKRSGSSFKPGAAKKDKSPSDEELFHQTMKEVQEIEEFRKIPLYQKIITPALREKSSESDVLKILEDIVKGRRLVDISDTQEYVEWVDQDYRQEIIDNLHRGKYSIQDCLDLHGVISSEAEQEVKAFIGNSVRRGYRCIKIIHGRGLCSPNGPVLKNLVIKWLSSRYRKHIVAFVTARQCDGGLGALYILLK